GGPWCKHRHANDDGVGGSGPGLRLLRPVPLHQRVRVFLRTESRRLPPSDSPRLDRRVAVTPTTPGVPETPPSIDPRTPTPGAPGTPAANSGQNFPILLAVSRAITAYRCICELQRRKPMKVPTQAETEEKLRGEDLNAWLDLWRTEQGPAKPAALKLIAAAIPFPVDRSLRVLDVGCGTGDAGRVTHSRFAGARIDCVDRNEFFVSLCGAVNRRDAITGQTLVRDLSEPDWQRGLASEFDVVLAVNTAHWFSL